MEINISLLKGIIIENPALSGLVGVITGSLITGIVTYFVNKKTEQYKSKRKIIEESQRVAELFALWVKYNSAGIPTEKLGREELAEYYYQLDRLAWELVLWIPEEQVVLDIMKRLQNKKEAKDIRQILLDVRKMLHTEDIKTLEYSDVVFFRTNKD
jgi:hypothetical protein